MLQKSGVEPNPPVASHSFLMCPPRFYDASFVLNPWMTIHSEVNKEQARQQWISLRNTLRRLGATIREIDPSPNSPAMVFTADGALVYAPQRALVLRNDGWRSLVEVRLLEQWLTAHGFATEPLAPDYHVDGGNILGLSSSRFLIGLKPGSSGRAERYVAKLLRLVCGAKVHPIALVDRRFLHIDMVIGDLAGRALLVYWEAVHPISRDHLRQWLDIPLIGVDKDDAMRFACNCVAVGDAVITGPISADLEAQIAAFGFRVVRVDLSEFYKAGGGAKCLTLPLT